MTAAYDATALTGAGASPVADSIQEGILALDGAFPLHLGGSLENVQVAWRMVGPEGAPVIATLGGISAGRFVTPAAGEKGWWSEIVGPGKAIDTNSVRVLGIDFLGGSGATTGPRAGQRDFPSISSYDQAELLRRLVDHLSIPVLAAIVGASYGGMVALAFAERHPKCVEKIVVISAADRANPLSTAWRSVQRAIVRYALSKDDGPEGLRLARALAMATYRSPQEFMARFADPPSVESGRYVFPVEKYLLARGDAYANTYLPEAFVCLSESIDLHRIDASAIAVPTALVAVKEDQLVPIGDMRALHERLGERGKLFEISSLFGHDAFLKEKDELRAIFARVLTPGSHI
jgi:homoserine O-acetyltransferase